MTQTWHDDIPDGKVIPGEVVGGRDATTGEIMLSLLGRSGYAWHYAMASTMADDPRASIRIFGGLS